MPTDPLLSKAQTVPLEASARPRRWAKLWPVYETLRARGLSCQRAVDWLIREGAISLDERERALNAFHIHATRRNKKSRAQADDQAETEADAGTDDAS